MYNGIAKSFPLLNQYPYGTFGFIEGVPLDCSKAPSL